MKKIVLYFVSISLFFLITISSAAAQTIYSCTNSNSGEDIYTQSYTEYSALCRQGWNGWGRTWEMPNSGAPVWRLYHPASGRHLYTLDANEVRVLTSSQGWRSDYNGQPVFYSGGSVPIYRLFNRVTGLHTLTSKYSDYINFIGPLNREGIKMYCLRSYY